MKGGWKYVGVMDGYEWIMCKGHGKCIWMDERKGKVKIKDGKRIKIYG